MLARRSVSWSARSLQHGLAARVPVARAVVPPLRQSFDRRSLGASAVARRDAAAPTAEESRLKKPVDALSLKCLVFDSAAKASAGSQIFRRQQFCEEHGLQLRDLRRIDSPAETSVPTILIRQGGILVNVLYVRVLIKHNALVLFEVAGKGNPLEDDKSEPEEYYISPAAIVTRAVQNAIDRPHPAAKGAAYEFKILDALLSCVVSTLEKEARDTKKAVDAILNKLNREISSDGLRALLDTSRSMNVVLKRSTAVRELIDELAESDELHLMYLSDIAAGKPRAEDDHGELDQLLESYSNQAEEAENLVDAVATNVQQTRDVIELILDSSRNRLLALDLKISIITASLTAAALFAAFFGMNLTSGLEESATAFWRMAGVATSIAVSSAGLMLWRLRKLRRIGLGMGSFGAQPYRRSKPHLPRPPGPEGSGITRFNRRRQ